MLILCGRVLFIYVLKTFHLKGCYLKHVLELPLYIFIKMCSFFQCVHRLLSQNCVSNGLIRVLARIITTENLKL